MASRTSAPTLALFNHGFDRLAHARLSARWPLIQGGFDLFAFPSQVRLAWLDLERFADLQALKARALGARAVLSHEDQFGALAAALVAERMGWPGTPVQAVLACQHKLHARRVLQSVCPEASVAFTAWNGPDPDSDEIQTDLPFPLFCKPVKAAFSILAREVGHAGELRRLATFGAWESQVLRWLVGPFDRICQRRLPQAGPALSMLLETPIRGPQFNLDGYVREGRVHRLGVVDAVMYPGTQAFMRFDYPSRLPTEAIERATRVAERFLSGVGFTHGSFNMEFFHDADSGRITVIEINPRLASQFSDLYERVDGINLHEVALALAHGQDPALLPRRTPQAGVASSFIYRSFESAHRLRLPGTLQRQVLQAAYPDALLMEFPKTAADFDRDLKWLGSCRHGILHLGGRDELDLRRHCEVASGLLGWTAPYADLHENASAPPVHEHALRAHALPPSSLTHPHQQRKPA